MVEPFSPIQGLGFRFIGLGFRFRIRFAREKATEHITGSCKITARETRA